MFSISILTKWQELALNEWLSESYRLVFPWSELGRKVTMIHALYTIQGYKMTKINLLICLVVRSETHVDFLCYFHKHYWYSLPTQRISNHHHNLLHEKMPLLSLRLIKYESLRIFIIFKLIHMGMFQYAKFMLRSNYWK